MKITPILFSLVMAMSCNTSSQKSNESISLLEPVQTESQNGQSKAYFASGCFWCVEAVFESVKGVSESVSGYSGGIEDNPTYKEVGYGRTTHAEAVEIYYDPEIVSFETLVDVFFGSHDPTTRNRQGPDAGPQYRSIAFYQNAAEKKIIEEKIAALNASTYDGKIVTQVMPFQKFWIAEGYHQNYERLNPDNPYIRNVSVPRLKRFQAKFPELLKDGSH
jgi:peptide-methionine (S)-S-oxide reductase